MDDSELWKAHKQAAQGKRAYNRVASAKVLADAGVAFESRNDGSHLVVAAVWDFWPGTGLYVHRPTKRKGRGVLRLLQELQK